MDIIGANIPLQYFADHAGHDGIRAAQNSFQAWYEITAAAQWNTPHEVQAAHPKASVLKSGRVVFNIKSNGYRLVCRLDYEDHIVAIRFFGSHAEYDEINAETI